MTEHNDPEMQKLSDVFLTAAEMMSKRTVINEPAQHLLARLDYLDGNVDATPHRMALLRAAANFRRIFTLNAVDAPGLVALGAEVGPPTTGAAGAQPGSVAGTGFTFRQAFETCVGEAVEYLSQFAMPDDTVMRLTEPAILAETTPQMKTLWQNLHPYRRDPRAETTAWVAAADLSDGRPVLMPADLCLRRPAHQRDLDSPWPLSIGCGAGPDLLDATLHGLLELIERDAVTLWWFGGQRARLVPAGTGAETIARLRGDAGRRRTWLLDITTDIGVPVVVAASCHDDGFGLCVGHAAAPTLERAADSAVREMTQMELAHRITTAKRAERGEAALNAVDRQHEWRFTALRVTETPALHPIAPPNPSSDVPEEDKPSILTALRRRLSSAGSSAAALNLTREQFGIPVVRAVCPGLELGLMAPPGPRLSAVAARNGVDPVNVRALA
jgi:ribosomal protein S12 methylthiotransferase accessory factor